MKIHILDCGIAFAAAIILSSILLFVSCSAGSGDSDNPDYSGKAFTLEYVFGTYTGIKNIYVIWLENESENFYYPVEICNRLLGIGGTLTNTALPYWKINKYPNMEQSEIDAVTGATKTETDYPISFSVPFSLPDRTPSQFTVYLETDVSNYNYDNSNDWFIDQPAILYKTDIDLDNIQASYTLDFVGWTPNETTINNEITYGNMFLTLVLGGIQSETKYITNNKDTSNTTLDEFLDTIDSNAQSTVLVDSITVIPQ